MHALKWLETHGRYVRFIYATDLRIALGREKKHCTWCNARITNSRTKWCSDECLEAFRSRCDLNHIRWLLQQRDKGICQSCGRDTAKLTERIIRGWHHARDIKRPYSLGRFQRLKRWYRVYASGGSWEADHIVPVIEGGGCCGLDCYRTLCLRCHRAETAKLATKRANTTKLPPSK